MLYLILYILPICAFLLCLINDCPAIKPEIKYYALTIWCLSGPSEPTECCGSRIAFGNVTVPTGAFHRLVAGPAFYLGRGVPLTADLSPPNRVLDLRLVAAHNDSLTVDLAWTAPGGDYDFGKGETRFLFHFKKLSVSNFPLYLPYFSSLEYKFIILNT
jgi:hypothetical protein